MSCIASSVSRRIASGSTFNSVRPSTSTVLTPPVVISRYGVSSAPFEPALGSRSEYRKAEVEEGSLTLGMLLPPPGDQCLQVGREVLHELGAEGDAVHAETL